MARTKDILLFAWALVRGKMLRGSEQGCRS